MNYWISSKDKKILRLHMKRIVFNDYVLVWSCDIANHNNSDRAGCYSKFEEDVHSLNFDRFYREEEQKYIGNVWYAKSERDISYFEERPKNFVCLYDCIEDYADKLAVEYLSDSLFREKVWKQTQEWILERGDREAWIKKSLEELVL